MKITLSWPAPDLWPNAHAHWKAKAPLNRAARDEGYVSALEALAGQPWAVPDGEIVLTVTGHKPAEHGQDLDGFNSALKPFYDGIASALKVNDRHFKPVVDWGENWPRGGVTVEIDP